MGNFDKLEKAKLIDDRGVKVGNKYSPLLSGNSNNSILSCLRATTSPSISLATKVRRLEMCLEAAIPASFFRLINFNLTQPPSPFAAVHLTIFT